MIGIARNASFIIRPHYLEMRGVKNMNPNIEIGFNKKVTKGEVL